MDCDRLVRFFHGTIDQVHGDRHAYVSARVLWPFLVFRHLRHRQGRVLRYLNVLCVRDYLAIYRNRNVLNLVILYRVEQEGRGYKFPRRA